MKWFYNNDGARLFENNEEMPEGYQDTPFEAVEEVEEPVDRDALKTKANELGLEFKNNIKTDKLIALIEGAE